MWMARSSASRHLKQEVLLTSSKIRYKICYEFSRWNSDCGDGFQLCDFDIAHLDPIAEKRRGRGAGVRRRRGGRAVWRGFGQCADENHQMGGGNFLRAGVAARLYAGQSA